MPSAAIRRGWPRRTAESAARTSVTPASQRKRGAAKPARTIASRKSVEPRSAEGVHASSVCASIITRTPMPRAQSMLADLVVVRSALVAVGVDGRGHLKIDVRVQGMPHGAVLLVRQPDRSLKRVRGDGAFDVEMQIDFQDAMRLLLRTLRRQTRPQRTDAVAPFRE